MQSSTEDVLEGGNKRRKKDTDIVDINVGGKIFTTSRTTLAVNSEYFAARFSQSWNSDEPIFLDQDADTFGVLLQFMRQGLINVAMLTESVLLLAEFLGVSNLLKAIKYTAYHNLNPQVNWGTSGDDLSVDEICRKYEDTYGTMGDAIRQGLFPSFLAPPKPRREFATITINTERLLQNAEEGFSKFVTPYVELQVPSYLINDPTFVQQEISNDNSFAGATQEEQVVVVPRCHTFFDAISWLEKHRFVTIHSDNISHAKSGVYVWPSITFSRVLKRCNHTEEGKEVLRYLCFLDKGAATIQSPPARNFSKGRRQFAIVLTLLHEELVYMNGGHGFTLVETGHDTTLRDNNNGNESFSLLQDGQSTTSRFSLVRFSTRCHPRGNTSFQYNWLESRGYTTRVPELEKYVESMYEYSRWLEDMPGRTQIKEKKGHFQVEVFARFVDDSADD